jgi:DNA-binding response OmpR family regulator
MEREVGDNVEFSIGKYIFNTNTKTLISGEHRFKLTTKETQLMRLLVLNKNELLERSGALKIIWHENNHFNSRSMDVFITKLRKYLKHDQKVEIVNVHGKGFKLVINS